MSFKAIDTKYNGYKFRSRLEARWAVFFDQLHVPYLYEPEGFDLDGVWYLPDFFLQEGIALFGSAERLRNVWIEIKPNLDLDKEEKRKAALFTQRTGYELLLIAGDPGQATTLSLITYQEARGWRMRKVCWVHSQETGLHLAPVSLLESSDDSDMRRRLQSMANARPLTNAFNAARAERFQKESDGDVSYCTNCGKQFRPYRDYHYLCRSCYRKKGREKKNDPRLYRSVNVGREEPRSNRAPVGLNLAVLGFVLLILVPCMALSISSLLALLLR